MHTAAPSRPARVGERAAPRYRTDFRYTDRASKATYIARKYGAILTGRVLDVGCDAAPLRALLAPPASYLGVDVRPDADVVLDLDRDRLPFPDRAFDTVLCTDVLEYLERCHAVFDDLCRVSRDRVVISLPNPLRNLLLELGAGTGGGRLKHYGLPVHPPGDRHRWFFGAAEAEHFVRERAVRNRFEVEQIDHETWGGPAIRLEDGTNLFDHPNVRAGTLWCVLRRAKEEGV